MNNSQQLYNNLLLVNTAVGHFGLLIVSYRVSKKYDNSFFHLEFWFQDVNPNKLETYALQFLRNS